MNMMFTKGKIQCSPRDVDYNESRIEVLEKHFERMINEGEIVCATYCASRRGKIFMHGGVGKQSYREDDNRPVQPDAIQYVASITKIFTSVAVMQLVENGLTRLNVPVGDILPQFNTPPYNKITLFHLLTHTSGLYPDSGVLEDKHRVSPWQIIREEHERYVHKGGEFDWIKATLRQGVRMEPDKEWSYCSYGFLILGEIIGKLTGVFANKYIEDNVIKPLGMQDTFFNVPKDKANRLIIQNKNSEEWYNEIISGKTDADNEFWSKIPATGGGLSSTVSDLVTFGNAMLNKGTLNGTRILGRKAVEKMTSYNVKHMPNFSWGANEKDRRYGIGFDMRRESTFTYSDTTFSHEGAGACALYVDPTEELVVAWMVPYQKDGFFPNSEHSPQNIIWSGLI